MESANVIQKNIGAIIIAVITVDFVVATLANMFAQWLMEKRGTE